MPTQWLAYWLLGLLGAYLAGSIPFGLLIGLAKGVDVRQHGSHNIGTANVGRTLGRRFGVITFFLDGAKGAIPVLVAGFALGTIGRPETPPALAWAWLAFGVATVVGHMFPVWLKFKGGKGVATGFGALLAVYPILTYPALLSIAVWALSVRLTKYIGISSCIAALTLPFWSIFVTPIGYAIGGFTSKTSLGAKMGSKLPSTMWPDWGTLWPYTLAGLLIALLVVIRHRSNIARMLAGTEHRVGGAKPKTQEDEALGTPREA